MKRMTQLVALFAMMGIDPDEIVKRAGGPCICGHGRDQHGNNTPHSCGECGCGSFAIPPPTTDRK